MIGKLLGYGKARTIARYAPLANHPVKSAANQVAGVGRQLDQMSDLGITCSGLQNRLWMDSLCSHRVGGHAPPLSATARNPEELLKLMGSFRHAASMRPRQSRLGMRSRYA